MPAGLRDRRARTASEGVTGFMVHLASRFHQLFRYLTYTKLTGKSNRETKECGRLERQPGCEDTGGASRARPEDRVSSPKAKGWGHRPSGNHGTGSLSAAKEKEPEIGC